MNNRLNSGEKLKWTILFLLSLIPFFFPWLDGLSDIGLGYGLDIFLGFINVLSGEISAYGKIVGVVCSVSAILVLFCIWAPKRDTGLTAAMRAGSQLFLFVSCIVYILWRGTILLELGWISGWRDFFPLITIFFYLAVLVSLSLAVYHIVSWKRRQR